MKKKKPLKVFIRCSPNADCYVGWIRQVLPMLEAERQGLVEVRIKHFTWGKSQDPEYNKQIEVSEQEMQEDLAWCDVAYFSRNDVPAHIVYMVMASDFFKKPTLVDYDDLVWHTRPVNPGYRSFHPNSEYNQWNHEALKYITGMTVSTQFLADWYRKVEKSMGIHNLKSKFYIVPNSLDMEERDKVNALDLSQDSLYAKKEGEFRIMWSGSASHWENLQVALPAVKQIMKKYPNVTFYLTGLFGGLFDDVDDEIRGRVVTVPFVDGREYGKMLRRMNGDIAIAPLTDCNFNRAKSNLRLLEYGSVKHSTIASDVLPYQCFKNGKETLLVKPEEWYDAIELLIKDEKLRKSLGENIYKRIKKDFNIKTNCRLWVKALQEQVDMMKTK